MSNQYDDVIVTGPQNADLRFIPHFPGESVNAILAISNLPSGVLQQIEANGGIDEFEVILDGHFVSLTKAAQTAQGLHATAQYNVVTDLLASAAMGRNPATGDSTHLHLVQVNLGKVTAVNAKLAKIQNLIPPMYLPPAFSTQSGSIEYTLTAIHRRANVASRPQPFLIESWPQVELRPDVHGKSATVGPLTATLRLDPKFVNVHAPSDKLIRLPFKLELSPSENFRHDGWSADVRALQVQVKYCLHAFYKWHKDRPTEVVRGETTVIHDMSTAACPLVNDHELEFRVFSREMPSGPMYIPARNFAYNPGAPPVNPGEDAAFRAWYFLEVEVSIGREEKAKFSLGKMTKALQNGKIGIGGKEFNASERALLQTPFSLTTTRGSSMASKCYYLGGHDLQYLNYSAVLF